LPCREEEQGNPKRELDYPEIELSNNLTENAMWSVVVGRKNWIHVGSAQAGSEVAAILSVVETCRRSKIAVSEYHGCGTSRPR
jgi:hypothetical protein